jgi:glycosyltransferase involved in cell wall biosynthesis
VRSFHEIYNPEMAIHVLAEVKKSVPGAELLMVGPDKDGSMDKCRVLATELGVADSVEFTGRLEKADWISRATAYDLFLNTTHFDNLPVSVIEALALGMIVISTNVGGIPYLIQDQANGMLVADGDVAQMTNCVLRVLNDEANAQRQSEAARKTAETYDWNNIKQAWNSLLQPLVDAGPKK